MLFIPNHNCKACVLVQGKRVFLTFVFALEVRLGLSVCGTSGLRKERLEDLDSHVQLIYRIHWTPLQLVASPMMAGTEVINI